jgi:hypothetical protein
MAVDISIKSIRLEDPSVPSADGTRRRPGIAHVEVELILEDRIYGFEPVKLTMRKEYPAIEQLAVVLREELVKLAEELAKGTLNLHI